MADKIIEESELKLFARDLRNHCADSGQTVLFAVFDQTEAVISLAGETSEAKEVLQRMLTDVESFTSWEHWRR